MPCSSYFRCMPRLDKPKRCVVKHGRKDRYRGIPQRGPQQAARLRPQQPPEEGVPRRRREAHRKAQGRRQDDRPRAHRRPAGQGLTTHRDRRLRGRWHVQRARRCAQRRGGGGDRLREQAPVHRGGQRRHGEGRCLVPHDRQEEPARAGDRHREPPAHHLPGGQRRRVPAHAGRDLPRQGALRTHFSQQRRDELHGHHADRRGDGQLRGGRGLPAHHER